MCSVFWFRVKWFDLYVFWFIAFFVCWFDVCARFDVSFCFLWLCLCVFCFIVFMFVELMNARDLFYVSVLCGFVCVSVLIVCGLFFNSQSAGVLYVCFRLLV